MKNDSDTFLNDTFIWDSHCGFEMAPSAPIAPLLAPWHDAAIDYFSINVYYDPHPWTRCVENIAALRRRLPIEAPWCQLVSGIADVERAQAAGKAAVTFDIEGMNALDGRIDMVQMYYELGVRQMLFAYNKNNLVGGGCHDEDVGLTDFGRNVIDEMNRVGMLVDCSHTSFTSSMEAMERSTDPVLFSHSNALALADHGRNITDEQIRACAATGGVVGINGLNLFLGDSGPAQPATVARHVAYMADLIGVKHVGIALDFDPGIDYGASVVELFNDDDATYWPPDAGYVRPIDSLDVRHMPAICDELVKLGFSKQELIDILGANSRRVAEQVWK
jgi:membrane dipeptidase